MLTLDIILFSIALWTASIKAEIEKNEPELIDQLFLHRFGECED